MDILELRDDLYQDIHKLTPSWWTVWGPYIVFAFIMLLLTLSYFIKYPDVILAEATFVSEIPSVTMPSKIDSKIISIKKNDGDYIKKNDYIIVFFDNCNYEDILLLKNKLEKLENDSDMIAFFEDGINHEYKLGIHLQGSWNNLMAYFLEYCQIEKQKKYDLEIDRLTKELVLQQKIKNKFEEVLSYNDKIEIIMERKKNGDSILLKGEFIGRAEYDESLKKYMEAR